MEVIASPSAKEFVRARGGTLYVTAHPHRCCTGSLTLLDTATVRPNDHRDFVSVLNEGVEVKFASCDQGLPNELTIDVRGRRRRHLVAFWDGCAFKP